MANRECEFPEKSGYGTVLVNLSLGLCEVGENCPATECPFRFKVDDVKPCPTCKGNIRAITDPPYSCSTCDVFGIVRIG